MKFLLIGMVIVCGIGLIFYFVQQKTPGAANSLASQTVPDKKVNLNIEEAKPQSQGQLQVQSQRQSSIFNENKPAPELTGITKWLNPEQPLTLHSLRGKVVLVDFWTNQCINCIRTLPYVTKWYDTYKDQGFVVIGVHTPELQYEYTLKSIQEAIKTYNIHYPVAQDNNYATWKAYDNQYWPAQYLIDKKGIIRRTHFGEEEYTQTEQAIQELLKEKS